MLALLDQTLKTVPFVARLGIRVEEVRPGHVVLRLPFGPNVQNAAGALHSGAVFSVGELAAQVALGTHPEASRYQQLQKSAKIKYFLPSNKDVTAHATVTAEMVAAIRDAAGSGTATVEVPVKVLDGHGKDVAELVCHFAFRKR